MHAPRSEQASILFFRLNASLGKIDADYPGSGDSESTDAVAISDLISVFEKAERTGEHRSASIAKLTIVAVDGKTWELSLLPGDDDSFYEHRYARRINRVRRSELLAVLRRLGAGDFFETTRSN